MSVAEVGAVAGGTSRPPARQVRFTGADTAYWRILVRGALLLMATLGIYRFWLATDIRRFLWANTEIDGESLEYGGTAIELLQGFLTAIALLLPVYTVFVITVLDLGALGSILSVSAVLLLIFLSQSGIYLARRYRLTRTIFRGLRFRQSGSAFHYSICAVWWWSLTVVTWGLVYPFTRAALERFKMRHTHYGDLRGRFEASGWSLFIRGLLMWLAVIVPAFIGLSSLTLINWPAASGAMRGSGDVLGRIEQATPGFLAAIGFATVMFGISLILIALLLPVFHAMTMRWWVSGMRLGAIAAVSHLRTRDVYWAYLRFTGYLLIFALLMAVGIFVGLLFIGLTYGEGQSQASEVVTVVMLVGTYVVSALGVSTLYQSIVTLSVWRLTAESTELSDTSPIGTVHAAGEASSPLGEGIADVLNLGGI